MTSKIDHLTNKSDVLVEVPDTGLLVGAITELLLHGAMSTLNSGCDLHEKIKLAAVIDGTPFGAVIDSAEISHQDSRLSAVVITDMTRRPDWPVYAFVVESDARWQSDGRTWAVCRNVLRSDDADSLLAFIHERSSRPWNTVDS